MDVASNPARMTVDCPNDRGHVVRIGASRQMVQGPDYFPAISAETVGSTVLWFGMIVLPAGRRTKAHVHQTHETGLFMLSGGDTELWTGSCLQHFEVVRPGDYVFIPRDVLHVAVNRGSEPAVFIAARNEPTAMESLVLHPEFDSQIP